MKGRKMSYYLFKIISIGLIIFIISFLSCKKKNKPPDVPLTPSGPSRGITDTTYIFTTSSTDPDEDSICYQFDWGTGDLDTSDWGDFVPSDTTFSISKSWSTADTYSIKVRAKDKKNAQSGWSAEQSIIISSTNNPPNRPSIPSGPFAGFIDTIYTFTTMSTDPDSDSVTIRFAWGDGDTSDWSSWVPSGHSISMNHSWHSANTYYVRAQSKDIFGFLSEWSLGHQVIIESIPSIIWMKTYGGANNEEGRSVLQTSDGGYIVAGMTNSFGAGDYDVYLVKTNANGDVIWTRTYGGANFDDAWEIQPTLDGGYIIVGSTESFGLGQSDVYLIKIDADGNIVWTRTYGGDSTDIGYSVKQTSDGGYIIAGQSNSFRSGDSILFPNDMYLIKTNSQGDTIWTKTWGYGYSNEVALSVLQTSDNKYIVTGYANGMAISAVYICIVKFDANGDTLWRKFYGDHSASYSVQPTFDGGYIIAGWSWVCGPESVAVWLLKTDANGDTIWTKLYRGQSHNYAYSVQQTIDKGFIIAGWTYYLYPNNDVYLIKTNADGDSLWTKTFGGANDDRGYSVQKTSDGGYIVAGYTYSFGSGGSDIYLIKTKY
jgi:hypothetical protein